MAIHDSPESQLKPISTYQQPIAARSILGLYALAAAMFVISINFASWYADGQTVMNIIPWAVTFVGLVHLLAGRWAHKSRNRLATALHSMWGAVWMGYGLLFFFLAIGMLPAAVKGSLVPLGYWFAALAAITAAFAVAARGIDVGLAVDLVLLTIGSSIAAAGFLTSAESVLSVAGCIMLFSSFFILVSLMSGNRHAV